MTVKKTEKKKKVRSTINCKKTKKQTLVHPSCLVPSGGENISARQREFMKYESDVQPSMNLSITNIRSLTSIIYKIFLFTPTPTTPTTSIKIISHKPGFQVDLVQSSTNRC